MSGPDPTDTHTTQPIPTPTSSSSNVIPSALPPSLPRSASSPFMHLDVAKELESHSILQVLRHGHVGDEKNGEFRAVLGSGKASLFLPLASSLVHVAENVSSTFFEHHVFVRNPDNEMQLMSLGGIRALIKGQRLIIIGDRPTERELRGKRAGEMLSMWDTIDVETTTVDQYPSIELLSDTPLDVHLMDDASTAIKVHLMRRAIMHEDIAGPSQSVRTMDSKPPPTPPRPPPTYNTSLISLPTLGFDLTSVPSNVLTQIGAIPSLFGKSPSAATLLPRTTQPQQQHHQHHLAKVPALDADPQYVLFMTQMRDPRCQPLVAEINRYLVALTSSTTPVSSDEIAAYHAAFMHRVRTLVKESPAILTNTCADTKQVEQVLEGLDSYVLARGYPTYFVSILNEEQIADLIVHRKVSLLATVGFDLDSLGFPVVSAPDELRQTIKLAGIGNPGSGGVWNPCLCVLGKQRNAY
ncbi:hypothetical protein DFJ77DRAFT_453724 [Powellomyces hirtus]|nr:hypothetical protein DFJ77DRAFT_453724 [Powellomyces hirtus]